MGDENQVIHTHTLRPYDTWNEILPGVEIRIGYCILPNGEEEMPAEIRFRDIETVRRIYGIKEAPLSDDEGYHLEKT